MSELDKAPSWFEHIPDDMDGEDIVDHVEDIKETISGFTDDTRAGNLVYAQAHVLEQAGELLMQEYADADEYGEHEAKLIATAIIIQKESDNEVW